LDYAVRCLAHEVRTGFSRIEQSMKLAATNGEGESTLQGHPRHFCFPTITSVERSEPPQVILQNLSTHTANSQCNFTTHQNVTRIQNEKSASFPAESVSETGNASQAINPTITEKPSRKQNVNKATSDTCERVRTLDIIGSDSSEISPRAAPPTASLSTISASQDDGFRTVLPKRIYNQNKKMNKQTDSLHVASSTNASNMPTIPKIRPNISNSSATTQPTYSYQNSSAKIFVGGIAPNTKKEDILNLVHNSLGIRVGRFQLRTKYPSYSSFCVTTDDEHADIIMCSSVWPRGAKIMEFRGRRRNTRNVTNSTNASPTRRTQDQHLTNRTTQLKMDQFLVGEYLSVTFYTGIAATTCLRCRVKAGNAAHIGLQTLLKFQQTSRV